MTTLTKLETTITNGFKANQSHDEIMDSIYLLKVMPLQDISVKFFEVAEKLGFLMSKEQKQELVLKAIKGSESLPVGWMKVNEFIQELNKKCDNTDMFKFVKTNWIGDFPKKVSYELDKDSLIGKALKPLLDNHNITIKAFLDNTSKDTHDTNIVKIIMSLKEAKIDLTKVFIKEE